MNSKSEFFKNLYNSRSTDRTMLCLGPMSLNSVKAICNISTKSLRPITIVSSRNQIECKELGGGYVNNWSTETFLSDPIFNGHDNIIFGRDHGGAFQRGNDSTLSDSEAMKTALKSFEYDILSGMQVLHLDPSKYTKNDITIDGMLNNLQEMYGHCDNFARSNNKEVFYEIGGEGHGAEVDRIEELNYFLDKSTKFIHKLKLTPPSFCVAKLGSLVDENKNIGDFEKSVEYGNTREITRVINIIHKYGLLIKQHNADYLSRLALRQMPSLGIDSINIAPELGYIETKSIFKFMEDNNLKDEKSELIALINKQRYWEKWTSNPNLSEQLKAELSGHYLYSSQDFLNVTDHIRTHFKNFDQYLIQKISNYLDNLLIELNLGT